MGNRTDGGKSFFTVNPFFHLHIFFVSLRIHHLILLFSLSVLPTTFSIHIEWQEIDPLMLWDGKERGNYTHDRNKERGRKKDASDEGDWRDWLVGSECKSWMNGSRNISYFSRRVSREGKKNRDRFDSIIRRLEREKREGGNWGRCWSSSFLPSAPHTHEMNWCLSQVFPLFDACNLLSHARTSPKKFKIVVALLHFSFDSFVCSVKRVIECCCWWKSFNNIKRKVFRKRKKKELEQRGEEKKFFRQLFQTDIPVCVVVQVFFPSSSFFSVATSRNAPSNQVWNALASCHINCWIERRRWRERLLLRPREQLEESLVVVGRMKNWSFVFPPSSFLLISGCHQHEKREKYRRWRNTCRAERERRNETNETEGGKKSTYKEPHS